jgi:hypothetical protein
MGDVYFSFEPSDASFLSKLHEGDKIFAPADRLKPEAFFLSDGPPARRGGRGSRPSRGRGSFGGGRGRGYPRGGGDHRSEGGDRQWGDRKQEGGDRHYSPGGRGGRGGRGRF